MLIKIVGLVIPTFAMSYFKLPSTFCVEMESLMANFWWGQKEEEKKIHWIGWDKLCLSKFHGGLGFKKISTFNLAILAKQGWRLSQNESSLLHRLYKAKYFPSISFFYSPLGRNPSYAWCGI